MRKFIRFLNLVESMGYIKKQILQSMNILFWGSEDDDGDIPSHPSEDELDELWNFTTDEKYDGDGSDLWRLSLCQSLGR